MDLNYGNSVKSVKDEEEIFPEMGVQLTALTSFPYNEAYNMFVVFFFAAVPSIVTFVI